MSLASKLTKSALRVSGLKHIFGSTAGMRFFVKYLRPRQERRPPEKLRARYVIGGYEQVGRPVHTLRSRRAAQSAKHVLYLHGGGYVNVIVPPHWSFLDRLMKTTGCQVTVPLYGLAPEYTYEAAFELLEQVYRKMLEDTAPENIVFMGDSSGGGLALAFAQTLLEGDLPQPGAIVMLSPWLDLTGSNPAIAEVIKRDPMLAEAGAREAARMWAGGADLHTPRLSPIYGPLQGLAPLCVLIGTDDVLMPDCRRLRDLAQAQGQPLRHLEYKAMFHTWMLLPLPESEDALRKIAAFLEEPCLALDVPVLGNISSARSGKCSRQF